MNAAISLHGINKSYKLYKKNSDRLLEALLPLGNTPRHKKYNALAGINAEIRHGEIVALVGKNGSGKSTLLKIITGVVNPSSGQCTVNGRINAMLELGAGLNPELSGIDNIYFSLSLQGESRNEAKSLLPHIIAFAELGDFVNHPLKTYSSGMKARLAFAIASHSSPDILIVDEVLSVGDMRFKQKCTRRMQELMKGNTTVLFVSHDLQAVKNLCTRAIWLDEGKLIMDGDTKAVVEKYKAAMEYPQAPDASTPAALPTATLGWVNTERLDSFGDRQASIRRARLRLANDGPSITELKGGEDVVLDVEMESTIDLENLGLGMLIKDRLGNEIVSVNNYTYEHKFQAVQKSQDVQLQLQFTFPRLKNGLYTLTVALSEGTQEKHTAQHWIHDCILVHISNSDAACHRNGLLILDQKKIQFGLTETASTM